MDIMADDMHYIAIQGVFSKNNKKNLYKEIKRVKSLSGVDSEINLLILKIKDAAYSGYFAIREEFDIPEERKEANLKQRISRFFVERGFSVSWKRMIKVCNNCGTIPDLEPDDDCEFGLFEVRLGWQIKL